MELFIIHNQMMALRKDYNIMHKIMLIIHKQEIFQDDEEKLI